MTHQSTFLADAPPIEAGRQVAHLRHVLGLVEEIAEGKRGAGSGYDALEEAARISAAYERSLPVMQRRFNALAQETATWSAASVEALLHAQKHRGQPRAAAAQLARELESAIRDLRRTVQRP
ncbi:MAG TPA: hypothetical protein VF631_13780 [Allosphingosinicella sp.]|jgi:hypothetical protein|uniref:hypothetical protein n=1 Tax=Allosphingosinicella sp. TaxID=2823234 RepID=UPI002F27591F